MQFVTFALPSHGGKRQVASTSPSAVPGNAGMGLLRVVFPFYRSGKAYLHQRVDRARSKPVHMPSIKAGPSLAAQSAVQRLR
jgi:hypothetical protein